ncbi:MAG: efflux RND transporter periplasmic adaptor subunit [bacterium]
MSQDSRWKSAILEPLKGLGVAALLVVMMLWLSGAFVEKVEPGPPVPKAPPPPLKTQRVELRSFPLILEQMGSLRTRNEAQVSSRIMAQVKEVHVREGQEVTGPDSQGEGATVLAKLDDRDIQARLRQAQSQLQAVERALPSARSRLQAARAQLEAAKAQAVQTEGDFRRIQQLYQDRAATGQQLEHARAQKEVAEARQRAALEEVQALQAEIHRIEAQRQEAEAAVAEARVMLSHTRIQAPFSGKVVRKLVEVGDMVTPGRPLFILETSSQPELHAVVSESLLPSLRVGQSLEVQVDSLDRTLQGMVREITPSADPTTRTVLVKVSLQPGEGLMSGLFGRIRVPFGSYQALVVPWPAVRQVGQLHLVDVKGPDGHPERRFVTLGNLQGELMEILSGLKEGEEVVLP